MTVSQTMTKTGLTINTDNCVIPHSLAQDRSPLGLCRRSVLDGVTKIRQGWKGVQYRFRDKRT